MKYFTQYKKRILKVLLFAGLFFLIGFYKKYHVPKIKSWLLIEVEQQSRKHSPLRFWPERVELEAFPIGATFYNIRVLPQKKISNIIAPTEISSVSIHLSMWALLKGQLRIGELHADGASLNIKIPTSSEPKKMDLSGVFNVINQLPIDKLSIANFKINSLSLPDNLLAQIENLELSIEGKYDTLRVAVDAEKFKLKKVGEKPIFDANAGMRFFVDREGIYFSSLKLSRENSYLIGTGAITGAILKNKIENIKAKIRGDLKLDEVRRLLAEFIDEKKVPRLQGHIQFDSDMDFKLSGPVKASFSAKTENLSINQFDINKFVVEGRIDENSIYITKSKIENYFGNLSLADGVLTLNDNLTFSAKLTSESLEISHLLKGLGLGDIPVYTTLNGELPCSGQIKNKFLLQCTGDISGHDLAVSTSAKKPFTIVALKDFGVSGSVTVTDKAVSYKTELRIGKSKGESTGVISYADGFKIDYSSANLNFSDLSDLAGLIPEGSLQIKGTTSGHSKSAIFDLSATATDMWLHDFYLGKVNSKVRYRKGIIYFENTETQIGSTRFKGDLSVDAANSLIEIDGASPFVDVEDLLSVFKRKVTLPVTITGTGSANLSAHGPLDFSKLSYTLNSSLYRGTIADETFDQIQFNVTSKNGYVETRQATLSKGRSLISASGKANPDGDINLLLKGQNFQVEQSENLSRLKTNLTGNLNFEMTLTDYILKPNINLVGSITHIMVGEQPAQNSNFKLSLNDKSTSGQASLLGDAVDLSFNRSQEANGITEIDIKTNKWNSAQTFSIFSESLRSGSYQTSLTSQLHLSIPNNEPTNFSGAFTASDLFLRNGRAEMKINRPIELIAKNGIISANNFEITGENTFIRLKSNPKTPRSLGLTLEGRLDLSLASLFTPFLDDLRGLLKFSFSLDGTYMKPAFSGSTFIEDAEIRIKGFPHALEQVSADAIFNNDNIIINSVKGKIGGGPFSGNGRIQAREVGVVPLEVRGQFYDSKFNVPEGFNTRGSGEFFIKGSWFPYTVGVNFNVESGLIEKRTLDTSKGNLDVKPSVYLPKYLSAQRFSPINLGLDINIRRPVPVKMSISRVDIRSEVIGNMKINGPPESPLLTGKINIIRGGKITFRNNFFEIKGGSVEYKNADPTNPTLNIQADARVTAQLKNNDTRDYDIEMDVQGTAANPKITLSSQPALSENELISLLTLGFINESSTSGEEDTSAPNLTNTSYQLGSAFLSEQLGISRVLESRLGMQLDINSSYDSADKAEKHKFTLRKQWTPKFGTAASREIGKTNTTNVKAEYKLNKRLSVIGEWEGKEPTGTEQGAQSDKNLNLFGLDIEYKVDFR